MTILTVGSSQQFARIADAIAASHDGDTVQIQAGTYLNDFATVNTKITIQGVGGMAHLLATVPPPDGKAILTVNASVTMDHLEFSGAAVADANGAGIRYQGGDLTVTNCYFHDNQDGILGGGGATGSVTIRSSEFSHNGDGSGYSHNLYIGDVASLVIDGSYFHDSVVGHEIKSRAESTTITNSRIQDGPTGTGSYSIDVPNGGKVVIQGNVIQQGPNSQNPAIIAFGEEGNVHAGSSLTVTGNTILNDLASPSASAVWNATNAAASVTDNAIYGLPAGQVVRGPATVSGTTTLTSEPALVTSSPWTTAPAASPALLTPTPALVSVPAPSASGLVLSLSEDAWQGDAQFTISIDGQQVGGVRTATASHAAGQSQAFAIDTTLSAGTHQVGVTFVNDAWGGTASTDRNLFLNGATYNGQSVAGSTATLLSNGTASFSLTATDQTAPVTSPVTLTSAPVPAPVPAPSLLPVVAPSSGAYAFEGPKWASPTITWSFATSTYGQDAATPFSSTIGAAYQSTVQQAVQRWAAVSGLNLVQQADSADPTKAANIRTGFADLNTPTSYIMGYTSYHYTSASNGGTTFLPDTIIRLEDPSKDPLYAGSGGGLTYQGFSTTLYQTVLHEFGHALGLDHSTDPNTVMYATLGPANMDLNASDIAGIQALYGTTPTPVATPLPTIVAFPTPVPTPVPTPTGSLVVRLSEDAYQGDAQFTVSVDGKTLGGAQSVTALHGAGASQAFSFAADLAAGAHQVSISFLNDLWNPGVGDRNLYVDGITVNGTTAPGATAALYSAGHSDFTVTAPSVAAPTPTPVPTPVPTPTGSLVVRLSEDAYQGDAQFTVSVDGKTLGGAQSVTALHGAGASQAFSFAADLAAGAHQVSISFLNDLWNPGVGDRNLYVDGITVNGTTAPGATAALYSAGHSDFTVTAASVAAPTPVPTPTPVPITLDTLVLRLSEDAYGGDAQFTASVDGHALGAAQSVTAPHGAGASQAFTFTGSFGPGTHDLAVTFLNDLWNPATGADRNLYVQGAALNGTASASPGGFVSGDTHQPLHLLIGTASAA